MRIVVRGKNIDVTEALKEYARRKVGRIGRYFDEPLQAQLTLAVEKGRHVVEVTVPLPGNGLLLRAEEESDDMYASLDLVVDKLERQIRKFKTRLNRKARRVAGEERRGPVAAEPAADAGEGSEDELRVVRVKRFPVKPMSVEEAVLQMNLLGHDFFVFRRMEDGEINVVYRRRDGGYGLIEPEA